MSVGIAFSQFFSLRSNFAIDAAKRSPGLSGSGISMANLAKLKPSKAGTSAR